MIAIIANTVLSWCENPFIFINPFCITATNSTWHNNTVSSIWDYRGLKSAYSSNLPSASVIKRDSMRRYFILNIYKNLQGSRRHRERLEIKNLTRYLG